MTPEQKTKLLEQVDFIARECSVLVDKTTGTHTAVLSKLVEMLAVIVKGLVN